MSDASLDLARECRVFAVYLTGQVPTNYIVDRYLEAHRRGTLGLGTTIFERALISVACRHRFLTRVSDAYAGVFARCSMLRRKLVLLLALLETNSPSYRWIDDVPSNCRAGSLASMLGQGIIGSICLLVGLVLFTPIRVLTPNKKAI